MTSNTLFHIAFYCSALVVCFTGLLFTFIQQRTDKLQNKLYIVMVCMVGANALSLIMYEMAHPFRMSGDGSFTIMRIAMFLYFIIHSALTPCLFLYVSAVCGRTIRLSPLKLGLFSSLLAVTEFLVICSPVTEWVYEFDSNREFVRNWGEALVYISGGVYMLLSVVLLMSSWNALTLKRRMALIYFILIVITGIVIQGININIKCELFTEAIALLGVMMAIESEDDRIDIDTGIYNRKALLTDLTSFIHNKRELDLICIKITNSDLAERATGTDNSDALLKVISEHLRTLVPRYCIYSTDQSTFMITVMNPSDKSTLEMAEKISERFDHPWKLGDSELIINAVLMTAKIPHRISTASDALYMADCPVPKTNDKKILSGNDLDYLLRRAAVENAVRRGIEDKLFEVYYQPTFHLKDQKLHGAEALIRLHDSLLGNLFPDEFIPIAEQIGMIDEIDDFVLREVCDFIQSGIPQSFGLDCININLSVIECMQPGFVSHINSVTEDFGIPKNMINFEITESVAATDYDMLSKVVADLKAKGFHFSMDDYGTGYSNMRAIFMLDFDVVKIDKSILWSAEKSELGKIILENSVNMIKQMKREILVEGVETQDQLDMLSELSVDYLQGYLFSKPIPKADFIALMRHLHIKQEKALKAN